MLGGTSRENLNNVIADAINVAWSRLRERKGKVFDEGHHRVAVQGPFGVVVAENGYVRDAAFDEEFGIFEYCLLQISL